MDNDTEVLICPYCNCEQYTHEDDDISADLCLETCENCGKQFWYSVTVERSYYSWRFVGETKGNEKEV